MQRRAFKAVRGPLSSVLAGTLLGWAAAQCVPAIGAVEAPAGAVAYQPQPQPQPQSPASDFRWQDFFESPLGPQGARPTAALLAASGQRVRLTGYMVARELPPAGWFFLTPRPISMSEHADGDADDLPPQAVQVIMPAAERDKPVRWQSAPMQLTGRLDWGRQELPDGRVTWLRLWLDPRPVDAALPPPPP